MAAERETTGQVGDGRESYLVTLYRLAFVTLSTLAVLVLGGPMRALMTFIGIGLGTAIFQVVTTWWGMADRVKGVETELCELRDRLDEIEKGRSDG